MPKPFKIYIIQAAPFILLARKRDHKIFAITIEDIIIIIIYCLTSDSDPYWAYTDYSLYTYREKTLFKKTP